MKVKCTQCGKVFEAPNSAAQRSIKCLCKHVFLAVPLVEELTADMEIKEGAAAPAVKDEGPQIQVSKSGFDPNIDSALDPEVSAGEHLDEFVSFLKNSAAKNQSDAKIASPAPRRVIIQSVELAEEKPPVKKLEPVDDPEATHERTSTPPRPNPVAALRTSAPPSPIEIKRKQDQTHRHKIIGLSTAAGLTVLAFASYFRTEPPQERPADPYLTKLLTPKHNMEPVETAAPKSDPIKQEQIRTEIAAVNKPTLAAPRSLLLEKMQSAAFKGDFEDVVRIGSTATAMGNEEKALFLEALFERAGNQPARHHELQEKLETERKALSDPGSSPLMRTTAFAIIRQPSADRNLLQAVEILKSLSMTRSRDPFVAAYLGIAFEEIGRLDLAHAAWDEALHLKPEYIWILELRDQHYRLEKKYTQALAMAERLSKISGQELNGLRRLGEISELKNDWNSAVAYYRRAIKIKDSAQLRKLIGEILMETNSEAALKEFQAGLEAHPSRQERLEILSQIGRLECTDKNYSAASLAFQQALAEDPHSIKVIKEKSKCELEAKSFRSATSTLEKALTLYPNDAQLWLDYGRALSKHEKQRAAFAAVKHSIELKSTDQNHLFMAQLLWAAKKKQEAAAHVKKALQINPQNREAMALLKTMN